jgi:hypothetical protein
MTDLGLFQCWSVEIVAHYAKCGNYSVTNCETNVTGAGI